ncbi:MAG: response regulator transcription factor [Anaerolineae bacterium]|nr:response regulator transcription factor [Anaerolineae bacterium]
MSLPKAAQRILVVDDDLDIVRLVRAYLEKAGYQVLTAYDGKTAMHILRHDRPTLVVLDLMLPDRDGWDITRLVRSDPILADTPIIMLTARIDDTDKIIGLELGADDYITKPFNPREVVARVRSVLRRSQGNNIAKQTRVLQMAGLLMDLDRREVMVNGQPVELTTTEFSLLKTLLESPGYAFTRSELIEQALGYEYEGSERTLDSHMRNLRRKIEPRPGEKTYIQTVYGVGYRLVEV